MTALIYRDFIELNGSRRVRPTSVAFLGKRHFWATAIEHFDSNESSIKDLALLDDKNESSVCKMRLIVLSKNCILYVIQCIYLRRNNKS